MTTRPKLMSLYSTAFQTLIWEMRQLVAGYALTLQSKYILYCGIPSSTALVTSRDFTAHWDWQLTAATSSARRGEPPMQLSATICDYQPLPVGISSTTLTCGSPQWPQQRRALAQRHQTSYTPRTSFRCRISRRLLWSNR
jgi:hypothetical protein